MTMEPEKQDLHSSVDLPDTPDNRIPILEDLFYLGYTTSDKINIYKKDKSEINVIFRTITPVEHRDIFEYMTNFSSTEARLIVEKMEILARAIKTINDMPLVLDVSERERFKKDHDRDPSPLDQARHIVSEKIKSVYVIDALFEAYTKFVDEVRESFEDIKKK